MKQIILTDEDYEFLKDLQHELNTQSTDGTAEPVYWGVMEDHEVAVPDGCGDYQRIPYDDGAWTVEEAVEIVEEDLKADDVSDEIKEEWNEYVDHESAFDVASFMSEKLGYDYIGDPYDCRMEEQLTRWTGAFLTKRACKQYVERYAYNHNNPRTYALYAHRNFELERLLKILKTMEMTEE